jgi:hypothetical protein
MTYKSNRTGQGEQPKEEQQPIRIEVQSEDKQLGGKALQRLYEAATIETVHAATECAGFYFAAQRSGPRGDWDEVTMPPGNYLIVKIVEKPTARPGLYAVKAPREEFWDCTNCKNRKIGGAFKECPSCGRAREEKTN